VAASLSELLAAVAEEATAAGQPSERAVEAARLYARGLPILDICARLRCSTHTARRLVVEGGGTIRGKHRHTRAEQITGHPTRAALAADVRQRFEEVGETRGLPEEFGLARSTIWALLLEAGVPRDKLRDDPAVWRAQAVRLYTEQRVPLKTLAEQLGVSRPQLRWALVDAGVTLRKVGRPAGIIIRRLSLEQQRRVATRYATTKISLRAVAKEFGLTVPEVQACLEQSSVRARGRGGQLRPAPLNAEEKAVVRELYARMSMSRLVQKTHFPYELVKAYLTETGLLRPPGPRGQVPLTPERRRLMVEAYAGGMTLKQVQAKFHISEFKLRPVLLEAGVLRPKGPPLGTPRPPRK
jgi:transposase